jgi:hypothetical protein
MPEQAESDDEQHDYKGRVIPIDQVITTWVRLEFQIRNTRKDGFGYKDQAESTGPCQCDCPRASCASCGRSPIFPIPATPPNGGGALPPATMSGAGSASGAHRCASAVS